MQFMSVLSARGRRVILSGEVVKHRSIWLAQSEERRTLDLGLSPC